MGLCLSNPSGFDDGGLDLDCLASTPGTAPAGGWSSLRRGGGAGAGAGAHGPSSTPGSPFSAAASAEWVADVEAYTQNLDLPMVK